jgi:AraC-like DNA-binding protein
MLAGDSPSWRAMTCRVIAVDRWLALARKCHYNAKALAQAEGVSIRQLERDFRERLGLSPQRWLDLEKLAVAKELLLAGSAVKRVAIDLGYKRPSHFCRHFKMRTGVTPAQFVVKSRGARS